MGYVQLPCHETFLKFVSRWKNTFSPPFFQDKSTAQGIKLLNDWKLSAKQPAHVPTIFLIRPEQHA